MKTQPSEQLCSKEWSVSTLVNDPQSHNYIGSGMMAKLTRKDRTAYILQHARDATSNKRRKTFAGTAESRISGTTRDAKQKKSMTPLSSAAKHENGAASTTKRQDVLNSPDKVASAKRTKILAKKARLLKNRSGTDGEPKSVESNTDATSGALAVIHRPLTVSELPPPARGEWINKQRVLVFGSRGINFRQRHLMNDVRNLLPHSKTESKMNKKEKMIAINEICEMKNCNMCLFFEARKKRDLYMWISRVPDGPCAKFLVENIHTMGELKMTGNCLKSSRPLLSFDPQFDKPPFLKLLKEMFVQVFSTPNQHPKSQPFFDHVITFSQMDNRIWFRNYQLVDEGGALTEIGPRMTLNLVKIFDSSFGGATLYENPYYASPNVQRRLVRMAAASKYVNRVQRKATTEKRNISLQQAGEESSINAETSKEHMDDAESDADDDSDDDDDDHEDDIDADDDAGSE